MAIRSRYRERLAADNSAERIPESNIQLEIKEDENRVPPSEQIHIEFADSGPVTEALQKAVEADEAAERLRQQIDHLHRSEEWQRQRAAQMMQQRAQPMSRVEFLQSQGLTRTEAEFFDSREDMMANQQQASEAASEALAAGLERDSPQFFQAVEENFAKRLDALNQRAVEQPTLAAAPAVFAPRPAPPPAPPDRSGMYSAPVSRGAPGTYREPSPSSVRLSPAELEIAQASKISATEYARLKLKMLKERAAGERER